MKNLLQTPDNDSKELAFELTLQELQKKYPGKTMLTAEETAQAYGFKNVQSIYNCLRKNAPKPFPVMPKRRCGKLYWNIVQIAVDQAS